jgi:hypothetical protein
MGIRCAPAEWLMGLPAGSKALRCKVLNTQREPLFQREIREGALAGLATQLVPRIASRAAAVAAKQLKDVQDR